MALELRQQLKLAQRLVMTPQLRQAIYLLQLNRIELGQALQKELEQNPVLEADFPQQEPLSAKSITAPAIDSNNSGPKSDQPAAVSGDGTDGQAEINWSDYANDFDNANFSFARETPADAPSQFDFISEKPDLPAYLQWQLAHCHLEPDEWETALFITGNINRHGFLEVDLATIMAKTGCDHDSADYLLEVIQGLDPPGVAARDIGESLGLQLERLGMEKSLAYEIVTKHISLLETKNYQAIAKLTGKSKNAVIQAASFITGKLTPYPGLAYADEATSYVTPDVYVDKIDGEWVIYLNEDDLPKLKLSGDYLAMLEKDAEVAEESRSYLKEKLKDAAWLIKAIQQRQRTIYKVMESLLKFQHDFFEYGVEYLKPLVLHDVAEDIEMHESTVSRITSNKYVQTPVGTFELKYFFSTAIQGKGGEAVAAESIKSRIKKMVQEEDKHKPLSDNAISKKLEEGGVKIARRTVAKYREQLKIPPVKHRRMI
ncbi:MAG: RNA polymerase sigma-54 factor [Deltaproteobacteria bacterium]|nr:MAG: RNA polymerase sigma-54 factor [Deltaproteobacteria bacterium]